ncbi:MAG: hypothetical protein ACJAZX_000347 [Rickettsiales bacterium]|jgi:hypothetical protein
MSKSVLFIVEKNILDGKSYFGASNDLLLISSAIKMGFEVYVSTPADVILNCHKNTNFPVLRLKRNIDAIDKEIKRSWAKEVVNCFLAISSNPILSEKERSKILFLGAKKIEINLNGILIFNRAEPISLNNKFYDLLISWQNIGLKIAPNPYLNKILGDKLAINAIHENFLIAGIDLLEGVNLEKGQNEISFKTKIIPISRNNLSGAEIVQFYDLIIADNFSKAQGKFAAEYQIFINGAEQYLEFHQKLGNDSILKPADYFGGTGIVVAQNQILNLNAAIANISKSFLAIKQDSGNQNIAFLPAIIAQERASKADLGDLRIVLCGGELQGIFVRVNPDFEKSKVGNLHCGGHAESLFKHYEISKAGIDLMIADAPNEAKKIKALYGLLEIIDFLKQIKIFQEYAIIGADALLTCEKNGDYKYAINEVNLTSPMGQVQLLLLQIAVKFSKNAANILNQNDFDINLEKHQILADYFNNQSADLILKAQEVLLQDEYFQGLISTEIEKLLINNFAHQTLLNLAK